MNSTVFAALGDPTRAQMIERLGRNGPASIKAISVDFPLTRQAVTKHLNVLQNAGLLTSHKTGREQIFELQTEPMAEASAWLTTLASEWDHRLAKLKRIVEST